MAAQTGARADIYLPPVYIISCIVSSRLQGLVGRARSIAAHTDAPFARPPPSRPVAQVSQHALAHDSNVLGCLRAVVHGSRRIDCPPISQRPAVPTTPTRARTKLAKRLPFRHH